VTGLSQSIRRLWESRAEITLSECRITTKAQPFIPVDLSKITEEVVSDLEIRIEEVEGTVEITDLPTIFADSLQMRQLMQNLIGNALKYHKEGVSPVVQVSATIIEIEPDEDINEDSIEMCEITVEDNGIGFDEKYSDRIFGIFQRLHNRTDYEGTGVGLAICRKIADRHGGTIEAHSEPGKGSRFVVMLPVKQVDEDTEDYQ